MELSKREYIAAMVLQGLLAGCDENYNYGSYAAAVSEALSITDELLKRLAETSIPKENGE
jgi:hypothetical protein